MRDMRILGNMIQELSVKHSIPREVLCSQLKCTPDQLSALFKGRFFIPFESLEILSHTFNTTVTTLFDGDPMYYEQNVVHCMGTFTNPENREFILDLIDDYIDVREASATVE